jgi:hypothetical protein
MSLSEDYVSDEELAALGHALLHTQEVYFYYGRYGVKGWWEN